MTRHGATLMALALLVSGADARAVAQTPPQTTAAAPATTSPAADKVPANTLVEIEIADPISTRTAKRGDMFGIRLAKPILLNGAVLVPAGVLGKGQVVDSGKAGMGGKPAKLVLAARYLDWNGQQIPLHGFRWAWSNSGQDLQTQANTLAMVPYAGMLSYFVKAGDIEVPSGVPAEAKLGVDLPSSGGVQPGTPAPPQPAQGTNS